MRQSDEKPHSPGVQRVAALESFVGRTLPVLDGGFVRLVDYMGDDHAIVQAARISYGRGTKSVRDDRRLIRYLLRHRHTTPFEMCEIKLHVRAPMDVWRQWVRHRTANVNEYSTRYSQAIEQMSRTDPNNWRTQSATNRQGSSGGFLPASIGEILSTEEERVQKECRSVYDRRIDEGVAREQARKDLPLSTFTEAYWKIDLHNLLHFLELRLAPQAQLEIRLYARAIADNLVSNWVPLTWQAFQDYSLNALRLTAIEVEIISLLVGGDQRGAIDRASHAGWLSERESGKLAKIRERTEAELKFDRLGIGVPWPR